MSDTPELTNSAGDPADLEAVVVRLTAELDAARAEIARLQEADGTPDAAQRRADDQRMQAILQSIPIMLYTLDKDGVFTYSNGKGLARLGLKPGQLVGVSIFALYGTLAEYSDAVRRAIAGETVYVATVDEGTGIGYEHWLSPLFDEAEQPAGAIGVAIDVSERLIADSERTRLQEEIIEAQRASLRELSTPLIPIADNVIALPLVGSIDSSRAQQIMETLLEGIAEQQADVAILDITGVRVVDTQVANALLRAAQAAKLLGTQVILSGISSEVAQTLVGLGADMSTITTAATLQAGVSMALHNEV